ncbi:MAG: DNA repair protein RecO [Christensenellaceae bacterium]|nr:DNA repair protein RecO [Christensenellaceae bacterium]
MYENFLSIVLRSIDYKDNDRMLTLLTREKGKISCLARGARKQNNPLFGLSDVFVCADFGFFKRGGKYVITQGVLKQNFYNIRINAEATAVAAVIAESCEKAATEEGDARLFALLAGTLFALDNGAVPADVFCFFVIKLLDVLGMRPDTESCVSCGSPAADKLSITLGGTVCDACAGEYVPHQYIEDIRAILNLPSRSAMEFNMQSGVDFIDFCARWLTSALLTQPKSLKVMHTIIKKS